MIGGEYLAMVEIGRTAERFIAGIEADVIIPRLKMFLGELFMVWEIAQFVAWQDKGCEGPVGG